MRQMSGTFESLRTMMDRESWGFADVGWTYQFFPQRVCGRWSRFDDV